MRGTRNVLRSIDKCAVIDLPCPSKFTTFAVFQIYLYRFHLLNRLLIHCKRGVSHDLTYTPFFVGWLTLNLLVIYNLVLITNFLDGQGHGVL